MSSKAYGNVRKLNSTINVAEYGALGDNVTDDAAAIQAAVNAMPAAGAVLVFPPNKTFLITTPINFTGKSNFAVYGYGSTIRCGATRITSYFNMSGASDATVEGFTFDGRVAQMPVYTSGDYPTPYNVGVYADTPGVTGLRIENCLFKNLYVMGLFCRQSNRIVVSQCRFTSPVQTQDQNLQHLHFQTCADVRVLQCDFDNAAPPTVATGVCGIFASNITGNGIIIDGCNFNYCGRDNTGTHRLGVIDFYWDVVNARVTNCVSRNTLAQFMRASAVRKGVIANNKIYMSSICEIDYNILSIESGLEILPGIAIACEDITVSGNSFEDNASRMIIAVGVFSYDWGGYARNTTIENNSFVNCRRIVDVSGPFLNLIISNNVSNATTTTTNTGLIALKTKPLVTAPTTVLGTEANSFYDGLLITGNMLTSVSAATGVLVDFPSPGPTAFVGSFMITNNAIIDRGTPAGNSAIAIDARSSTPANNKVIISGNTIENIETAFQLRDSGSVKVHGNIIRATVNELIQSGNLSFSRINNTFRNNPLSGLATLAAGTVTVTGADCSTGDTVMISRRVASGTEGHLSVSSVGNGTFTILSSSATDASQVYWLVVH